MAEAARPLDLAASSAPDVRRLTLDDFHSADPAMQRCLQLARMAAGTDLPILILGESGTGKSLLARAIHNSSRRAQSPFISFNAAALSDTLLDSQLFGHEKGAFTGADRRVKGKFELAHGGTLFIDEIADMSLVAQAKVLRAVEYGEFEPLGSDKLQVAEVRLISATHLPLRKFIASDRFRRDLFYRISGVTLAIPALSQRPSDLRALIASEIILASRKLGKPVTGLDRQALALLLGYAWPGNLRELNRVVHAAVALSPGDVLDGETVATLLDSGELSHPIDAPSAGPTSDLASGDAQSLTLSSVERRHILAVLARFGGNKRQSARALGLSRSTLDRKLGSSPGAPDVSG